MSSREVMAESRARAQAVAQLRTLAGQHAAILSFVRRTRAGHMQPDRCIALVEAVIEGHAVVQWLPTVDPGKMQLKVYALPTAPAAVHELLRAAALPALDPAEQSMCDAAQGLEVAPP